MKFNSSGYAFNKRKIEEPNFYQSENSSEYPEDHISTSISSQVSLSGLPTTENKKVYIENIPLYPLTKPASKSLQQLISKSSPQELNKLIFSIKPFISDLMTDLYGNYLCQTLFYTCSADQRLLLLESMKGSLLKIAFHTRGTHALQNLISLSNLREEEAIYREEFSGHTIEMSKDLNASHIVQRLLTSLSNKYFITREILGNVKELALDKLGVCVIKKCCNDPEIMNEIIGDCLLLMQHPYGNYAVQAILEI